MGKDRHLEMDELLGLRDGEISTLAREHVEDCRDCQQELERLHQVRAQLRALPVRRPPRDLWPRVAASLRARRLRRQTMFAGLGLAAAVAAGLLVLSGSWSPIQRAGPTADLWMSEAVSEDLGPMIHRSRELESLLRSYSPATRVYDAPTALAVSVLEDRIVLLDRLLVESRALGADRDVLQGLWSERVDALETLVGVELANSQGAWR